ncbi:tetratricopeptide repeat protein [Erythrobacter oryzae]|uniref:tetratricopeptide repeat protein n=1 Tax=Erythrobacter oryzae TaxID=3019556 RepID=UPI00255533FB|nr:tetratricopeptide repeat protein [Erythrobacter sp. COR-2]
MAQRIFISAVSREFGDARDAIADRLRSRGLTVEVQSAFAQVEGTTLAKLHDYIKGCDRVLALVGDYSGAYPPEGAVTPELRAMVPEALAAKLAQLSYTQWEVVFARHYGVKTFLFESDRCAPEREPGADDDAAAQAAWRAFLFDGTMGLDRRQFANPDQLAAEVMSLHWPVAGKPCNLPGSIGHLFKGRDDFLDQLTESFRSKSGAAAIVGTAMHGLGGVGKTRAAVEYGYARQEDYSALFFLVGKSPNDLTDGLANLCGVLELEQKDAPDLNIRVAAVVRWLKANPGWLLVIDNVDDAAAAGAVRQFLNEVASGKGHVLITSRLDDWGFGVEALQLDLLSLDAAMELLREATPHRTRTADEDAALRRLADEQLGCLSLALVQAAAYIDTRRISFARYSQDFDKQAPTLLAKFGASDASKLAYPMAVAQTWLTSFEQLGPEARLLLDMLAWLSIEPLPRSLWDVWPLAEKIDLEEALADLSRYSFVRWEDGNAAITVHRLVQEVARDLQSRDEARRDAVLEALFGWLYAANPEMHASDVRCWPVLLPLLPHGLRLFERTRDLGPYAAQTASYNEYAAILEALARFGEAEPLYRRALAIEEASLGPDHPNVATRLNNLAELLRTTNRLGEAEPLYRRALAIHEASRGPDHPNLAIRLNNLAGLLQETNRLAEAEPLVRRALAIDEASYGPDHPEVARDLNNLASLLQATNRLGEAEPLYRRALAIAEASLGPDHPEVAIRLNNLAGLFQDTSRLDEAEPLYRRALTINEASYGPDHPRVATCLNNLAELLRATDRQGEAEPLHRRALAIDEASYGPDHPAVAVRLNNLALLLSATNRLGEAEPLFRRCALILLKSSKASGHLLPYLRPAIINYASCLVDLGWPREKIIQTLAELMIEGGFDPAELWPHIFRDD